MNREKKQFLSAIAVGVMALIWFYMVSSYFFNNNLLISINSVTWDNILIKLADDYSAMLFIPTIIIIINRNNLKDFNLCLENKKEIYFLILVMITFFILHNDFSIRGFYKFFFYLVVVSFGEEFLFRGFVYNRLKIKSEVIAIILSGMLWGVAHAILPSIQSNKDIIQMLFAMRNEVFGGILSGWYFIYLQEKSKTLWFPVLIHALLDYSFSFWGALVAVVAFIYLKMKSKKCKLNSI
jgi:membrane protease YdiL (CAAX protease family)